MSKEEIIKRYGRDDGNDDFRYEQAIEMSARIDKPIFMCFEGFVNLENKGLISVEREG